ncbi:zf-HC2 domain-containing protein [Paractinoplanes lichenicola]|uniref:Zf-HC2 domain-containing protein n=1 Tax=Paractinoplanes lichenicola TaxID=2802976 RepID=A0ABS1VVX4_9ACTN|nr:zf-HC2 domain-containing protein [Actinoplanes lichenicola]MBL7258609.1 zf-HC2 domain-containing protein [Actinoplanes lichenicola]
MKDHLPAYAAGVLDAAESARVSEHLADCPDCRADLAAWQSIATAAPPARLSPPDPARLVRTVLTRSATEPVRESGRPRRLRHLAALLLAEARLIRPAVPIASALVMALGVAVVLLQPVAGSAGLVLSLIAPLVAAAGVAGTYRAGPELIASLPTSGRLLLLVRLALVFGYDLVLATAASAVLAAGSLHTLIAAWLGPMALLASLSLLVAVRFGPDVALGVAVGLWSVRVLAAGVLLPDGWPARFIVASWSTTAPVLAVSAAAAIVAVAVPGRGEPGGGRRATHSM